MLLLVCSRSLVCVGVVSRRFVRVRVVSSFFLSGVMVEVMVL